MPTIWQRSPKPLLIMAPMEGVTDSAFRRVMVAVGRPDLMMTEFTSVDGLYSRGLAYVRQRLAFTPVEKPLVAQIWGTQPDLFYKAAKLLKRMGFDGIDLNMGCPDKAVMKAGVGAQLIGNRVLAAALIAAAKRGAGDLPVSVKTRIGINRVVTEDWARFLLAQGIEALTVHGRTAQHRSERAVDWEEIGKVVQLRRDLGIKTVLIGNGDVQSRAEALDKVSRFGVDGVMIGRGVLHNPWLFCDPPGQPNREEKLRLLLKHMELFEETWGDEKPFVNLRKYFQVYAQGFRGSKRLRIALMQATNQSQVRALVAPYLSS